MSAFSQYVPEGWSDATVQTFTAPGPGPSSRTLNDPQVRASITVAEVHASSLEEAVRASPPPMGVDHLKIIFEQMRDGEAGRFFERVIRFSEPFGETPMQQSLRIVEVAGRRYALSLSCVASSFKQEYEAFSRSVGAFIRGKQG